MSYGGIEAGGTKWVCGIGDGGQAIVSCGVVVGIVSVVIAWPPSPTPQTHLVPPASMPP